MKRLLAFIVMAVGLGMMLSGCTIGSHYIKESYIEKNYIDKVKVPESKRVGDRNIKFYVGKVVDKREDKYVFMKRMSFAIPAGAIHFKNFCGTLKHITEKALYNTGWGVVDNKNKANFIVDTVVKDFTIHMGLILPDNRIESEICLYNRKNGKVVIEKRIYKENHTIYGPDFTGRYRFIVGDFSKQYYTALINYFSSPEFVKAIKKAYAQEVNDDSTVSH